MFHICWLRVTAPRRGRSGVWMYKKNWSIRICFSLAHTQNTQMISHDVDLMRTVFSALDNTNHKHAEKLRFLHLCQIHLHWRRTVRLVILPSCSWFYQFMFLRTACSMSARSNQCPFDARRRDRITYPMVGECMFLTKFQWP